jgi:hypothetical protein
MMPIFMFASRMVGTFQGTCARRHRSFNASGVTHPDREHPPASALTRCSPVLVSSYSRWAASSHVTLEPPGSGLRGGSFVASEAQELVLFWRPTTGTAAGLLALKLWLGLHLALVTFLRKF